MEHTMWRFAIIEVPRAECPERDEVLWEQGRSGWELVQILEGGQADPADRTKILLVFKRLATADIGV